MGILWVARNFWRVLYFCVLLHFQTSPLPWAFIYLGKHVCTQRSVWWKCQTHFSFQIFCISSLLDDSKFFVRLDVSRSHHSDHPHQHFHPLHRSPQSLQNQSEVSEWGSGGRISGVRKFFFSGDQNYCQFSGDWKSKKSFDLPKFKRSKLFFRRSKKGLLKHYLDFWSPEKRPFRSPEIRFLDHSPGKLELYL